VVKGGTLVYKCRMCGELVKDTHVPKLFPELLLRVIGGKLDDTCPDILGLHIVPEHIGITDLIGGEGDE
jgi:hypothetical protein